MKDQDQSTVKEFAFGESTRIQPMKLRFHTGGLEASVATTRVIPNTFEYVKAQFEEHFGEDFIDTVKVWKCQLYMDAPDARLDDWNQTYMITLDGKAYAMCNKPVTGMTSDEPKDLIRAWCLRNGHMLEHLSPLDIVIAWEEYRKRNES